MMFNNSFHRMHKHPGELGPYALNWPRLSCHDFLDNNNQEIMKWCEVLQVAWEKGLTGLKVKG
jgi:hypothetical protein